MYKRDGGEEHKEMQRDGQTMSDDLMPTLSSLHRIRLRNRIFMSPGIRPFIFLEVALPAVLYKRNSLKNIPEWDIPSLPAPSLPIFFSILISRGKQGAHKTHQMKITLTQTQNSNPNLTYCHKAPSPMDSTPTTHVVRMKHLCFIQENEASLMVLLLLPLKLMFWVASSWSQERCRQDFFSRFECYM